MKWPATQCLACEQYSPHEAWYHYREPEAAQQERADAKETA
ncbi:MAG: hypothetical protein V4484_01775 [Pseudomonadota bacterium]